MFPYDTSASTARPAASSKITCGADFVKSPSSAAENPSPTQRNCTLPFAICHPRLRRHRAAFIGGSARLLRRAPTTSLQVLQAKSRQVNSFFLPAPPIAGLAARRNVREAILINLRADVTRRRAGERIAFEQGQHWGRAIQQPHANIAQPGVLPVIAERREQAVAVEAAKWFEPSVNREQRPRPGEGDAEHKRELQKRGDDGNGRERDGHLHRPLPEVEG